MSSDLTPEYSGGFKSWNDYEWFKKSIQTNADFAEIPVEKPYLPGFLELWFLHRPSGQKYRLVQPDPPFRGVWQKIT
jgi:hypothetical protein